MSNMPKVDPKELKNSINKLANDIKSKVDIVDHISKYENLEKVGERWVGPHSQHSSEGSDSQCFTVNPQTQLFNCFACEDGGDIISFEAQRQSISNFDAMKFLAEEYSIPIPDLSQYSDLSEEERAELEEKSNQIALIQSIQIEFNKFCVENLKGNPLKYLKSRGLTEETIEKYKLGYCPPNCTKFTSKFKVNDLIASGLFQLYENGNLIPVLEKRIIIPHLKNNRPVYFTGRSINKEHKPPYKGQVTTNNINEYAVERISILCGSFWDKSPSQRKFKKVLVTEGTFDCLLAAQEFSDEFIVISNNTVSMSELQFDFLARGLMKTSRREVIFCYDNDANNAGQKASFNSAKKFKDYMRNLLIRDYCQRENKSEKDLNEMLQTIGVPPQISEFMPDIKIAIIRRPPELESIDIADQIKNGRGREIYRWINCALTIRQYEGYLDNDPVRFNAGERGGFTPAMLSNEIEREGRFYLNVRSEIELKSTGLLYRYEDGRYIPDSNQLETIIHEKCPDIISRNVTEVITKIKQLNPANMTDLLPDLNQTSINLKNGWVDFDRDPTDKNFFQPHDPYKQNIIQLNVNYDPTKQCMEITKFLTDILPEHDIHEISKWISYSFVPGNQHQQALMCPGGGSNGKSTLFSVWQSILGVGNFSTRSLHDLEEKQFATYDLYGSLVNFGSEISSRAIAKKDGMFKAITGGDQVTVEPKHQNTFQMIALCILVFSANKLPFLNDRTYGNLRRWVYIPFDQKLKGDDVDKEILERLTTPDEISGLFNALIQAWKLLKIQGDFIPSSRGKEVKEEHISDSDRILGFCENFVEFDPDSTCLSAEIYAAYELYEQVHHGSSGSYRISRISFNRELKRIADAEGADYVEKKSDSKNKGWQTWFGVSMDEEMLIILKEESEYQFEDTFENIGSEEDNVPL